jgi:transposase
MSKPASVLRQEWLALLCGVVHTAGMGARGRPKQELTVTDDERETLVRWSRRPKSPHSLAQRSRIVLECAKGATNLAVAEKLDVNQATVSKWRRRFIERRLDGLVDEPRPGAPRTIGDDDVERVIVRTLEDKPTDATHWSTRDLAAKVGMSPSSVGRIWAAFGLKPWLVDTFKLSEDPMFVEKVRDVASRPSTGPNHRYRCGSAKSSGAPTTTNATVSLTCSRR